MPFLGNILGAFSGGTPNTNLTTPTQAATAATASPPTTPTAQVLASLVNYLSSAQGVTGNGLQDMEALLTAYGSQQQSPYSTNLSA